MAKPILDKTLAAGIWSDGADLKLSIPVNDVVIEIKKDLEKRLTKKGVTLMWNDKTCPDKVHLRILAIDQGNQLLRWLIPFFSPAKVVVEIRIHLAGAPAHSVDYTGYAHFGLLGGAPSYMLGVCARRVADRTASELVRRLKE